MNIVVFHRFMSGSGNLKKSILTSALPHKLVSEVLMLKNDLKKNRENMTWRKVRVKVESPGDFVSTWGFLKFSLLFVINPFRILPTGNQSLNPCT